MSVEGSPEVTDTRGTPGNRVWTVPNLISLVRLILIGVFCYLLLASHAYGWATAVLMLCGASDWADGKIARVTGQITRLGALLDPAIDRLYMAAIPIAFGLAGLVPWWVVIVLLGRDLLLAASLPALRSRGLHALPVNYIGKAGTFALMSSFPLILLGQVREAWAPAVLATGQAFLVWGLGMYLWSFVLYQVQVVMTVRRLPRRW